jgi:integrase
VLLPHARALPWHFWSTRRNGAATAHGLRKAACRRLAEAGCTEKQIAAISGHASLSEVQRYTKAADQERLARAAMKLAYPESVSGTRIGKPK